MIDEAIVIKKLRRIDLKYPERFQAFINSLVKENAKILINTEKTREDELKWLKSRLRQAKAGTYVCLVAWRGEEIVGSASCELQRERRNHLAEFAISIKDGYRGQGLGYELGRRIVKLAQNRLKPRPRVIQLGVYENNPVAFKLYEKLGFKEVSHLPRQIQYDQGLVGEILMQLDVSP